MGLPQELRLRKPSDFARVASAGRGRSNGLLTVRFSPNTLEVSRFGFSTSKKLGKAVERNRIKRRLREAARKTPLRMGYDLIVIARAASAAASYQELADALADAVRRAGLLAEPERKTEVDSAPEEQVRVREGL